MSCHMQGSRKSKIGWELTKKCLPCAVGGIIYKKKNIYIYICGLLDQFGWQPPFLLAHFG